MMTGIVHVIQLCLASTDNIFFVRLVSHSNESIGIDLILVALSTDKQSPTHATQDLPHKVPRNLPRWQCYAQRCTVRSATIAEQLGSIAVTVALAQTHSSANESPSGYQ